MTRKNKIMLAAAIVAAVLLVGSGVARCTIVQNGTIEGRAAVESAEEAAVENPQSETDAANGEANSDIESLIGTSWVGVDDATRSLSIVKGAFVETKDGSTEVTYWTLDSEEPLSSGIEATVLASKSMTEPHSRLREQRGRGHRASIGRPRLRIQAGTGRGQVASLHRRHFQARRGYGDRCREDRGRCFDACSCRVPECDPCHLGCGGVDRLCQQRGYDNFHARRWGIYHDLGHALIRRHNRGALIRMGKVKSLVSNRRFIVAFAATFALLATLFIPSQFAWGSIADDINAWLCGVLRDWCNWIFAAQTDVMRSLGANGVLSAPFETMLASAGDVSMYAIARGVWQVAVLPIGCGVLGLVFTLKLIEISQRMDGNQSFPGVKEVVFLLVFFAVFLFLIQHSFDLMAAIYEVIGLAIDRVEGLFGTGGALDMTAVSIVTGDDDLSALLALLVVAVISWLVVLVAYIVALVVCWARAIQLYVMAAFSPIPLAFLGFDQTRQIGLGYLKSFGAVCIAGLIILILLISFPVILGGIVAVNPGTGTPIDAIANGLTYALQYLAMCILLVLSLVKSGAWARDIVSGF